MNLQHRGADLINKIKAHVLEVLRNHPDAGPGETGIMQEEIARRGGLHNLGTGELDHTCGEILSLLHKEGKIELVTRAEGEPNKRIWRLRKE